MLQIIERNQVLVVDSRLIAEALGILHRFLKEAIRANLQDIETAFGKVSVETTPSFTSNQNEVVYFLTEDQATFLMTLSQNTPQVKRAKLNLVKK